MEGTPLLRLFLPRPGFTRYLMQRSQNNYLPQLAAKTDLFLLPLAVNGQTRQAPSAPGHHPIYIYGAAIADEQTNLNQ